MKRNRIFTAFNASRIAGAASSAAFHVVRMATKGEQFTPKVSRFISQVLVVPSSSGHRTRTAAAVFCCQADAAEHRLDISRPCNFAFPKSRNDCW